jgi:hypothetical protein
MASGRDRALPPPLDSAGEPRKVSLLEMKISGCDRGWRLGWE